MQISMTKFMMLKFKPTEDQEIDDKYKRIDELWNGVLWFLNKPRIKDIGILGSMR